MIGQIRSVIMGSIVLASMVPGAVRGGGQIERVDPASPLPWGKRIDLITRLLASDEQEAKLLAVAHLWEAIQERPAATAKLMPARWLKSIFAAGHHDELAQLARKSIVAFPAQTELVENMQAALVRALLAAGKSDEAVVEAKALYNVATLRGTAEAIQLLSEALRAAYPKDPGRVRKFRLEQLLGMEADAASGARQSVLAGIAVDRLRFSQAIRDLAVRPDSDGLVGKGNLLLLADRPTDAKTAFDSADALPKAIDSSAGAENVARAIKAQDGRIGRANSSVLSLTPEQ